MLSNSDRLAYFLKKYKITPLKVMLVLIGFHFVRNVVLGFVFNAWHPPGGQIGLDRDISSWFIDLLLQPTIVSYFVWIQTSADKIVTSLVEEEVVTDDNKFRALLDKWQERLRTPWIFAAAVASGVVMGAVIIVGSRYGIGEELTRGWLGSHWALPVIVGPMIAIYTSIWVLFMLDIWVLIVSLEEIISEVAINVQPLHPDGAGGLGAIGGFSANLGFGVGMFGLAISIIVFQYPVFLSTSISFLVAVTFYLILAPTILYFPVRSAHLAMRKHRDAYASEISDTFDATLAEIRETYSGGVTEMQPLAEKLNVLREANSWVMAFPVWPINIDSLRKYVGLTLSPVVPALITIIVDILI